MAQFPCDMHHDRYKGPQRTAYPAIVNGTTARRQRMRLCLTCFAGLLAYCQERLSEVADEEQTASGCTHCGGLAEYAIFVTLYDQGADRHDFYGRACLEHAMGDAAQALFGTERGLGEATDRL